MTRHGLLEPSLAPEATLDAALDWALAHAGRAPSELNSQPWRYRVLPGDRPGTAQVVLTTDPGRLLPRVDPDGREAHLACGAWLLNLRLALSAAGLQADVRTCPAADDPDLLALVDVTSGAAGSEHDRDLRLAIFTRATHRAAFDPSVVPPQLIDQLVAEAAREGALVTVLDEAGRRTLTELDEEAARRLQGDASLRRELAAWSRPNAAAAPDGIPSSAHGLTGWQAWLEPGRLRRGTSRVSEHEEVAQSGEQTATVLVVGSPGDGPAALLRAGAGMQRLLLRATDLGLAASYRNGALHVPDLRSALGRAVRLDHPQVVLRIGWGEPGPATGRRAVVREQDDTTPSRA